MIPGASTGAHPWNRDITPGCLKCAHPPQCSSAGVSLVCPDARCGSSGSMDARHPLVTDGHQPDRRWALRFYFRSSPSRDYVRFCCTLTCADSAALLWFFPLLSRDRRDDRRGSRRGWRCRCKVQGIRLRCVLCWLFFWWSFVGQFSSINFVNRLLFKSRFKSIWYIKPILFFLLHSHDHSSGNNVVDSIEWIDSIDSLIRWLNRWFVDLLIQSVDSLIWLIQSVDSLFYWFSPLIYWFSPLIRWFSSIDSILKMYSNFRKSNKRDGGLWRKP